MNLLALFGLTSLLVSAPPKEEWTEFRGPNGMGLSSAKEVPLTWSETQNIKWKTPIPGKGWSSPVLWKDQIWMTSATEDGKEMFAVCVDKRTGKLIKNIKVFENASPQHVHDINSYASPTPAIEEGRVIVHFGTYGTACYDTRTFQKVWERRDLNCNHEVGPGSSPVIFENSVIITVDGMDVQYIIALDKKTGKNVWKTPRSVALASLPQDIRKAFTTPILTKVNGRTALLSVGAQAAYAYDPRDGREIWQYQSHGFSGSCRPLIGHGLVFMNVGFGEGDSLRAVRVDGVGNITPTHTAWRYSRNVPNKPSMLLLEDLLYFVSDSGIITCLEAKTGKEVWKERLGGSYSASPVYANGHIYLFAEGGKASVLKPGRSFQRVAENVLESGFMATPAISEKAFYLRTKTHLYRVE